MTEQAAPESEPSTDKAGALRERSWLRWLRDGLLLVVLLFAVGAYQTRSLPHGASPAFALPMRGGGTFERAQLSGKRTLLLFWAPWCGVCRVQSQNVSWLQSLVGARAQVISVAVQYDSLAEVDGYVAAQGVDYPVLLGGRATARRFAVKAYPTAFFLDEHGYIKRATVGYTSTLGLLWRLML